MPRPVRVVCAALGVAVAVTVLTGCTKPTPNVTVLSGHTTTVIKPQTYCFSTDPATCHIGANVTSLSARRTEQLLVDVPREVATQGWSVTSAVLVTGGQFQTITGATYASTVRNSHSTRVSVPTDLNADSYYLIVRTTAGTKNGTWVAQVDFRG